MSDTKFTPPPWLIQDGFSEGFEVYAETPDNIGYYEIAEIKDLEHETEANANLIAAAPDMYEALRVAEKILGYLVEEYPGYAKDFHQVKAAAAKARGESNE